MSASRGCKVQNFLLLKKVLGFFFLFDFIEKRLFAKDLFAALIRLKRIFIYKDALFTQYLSKSLCKIFHKS